MSLLTPPETGRDHEAPRLHSGDAPQWTEMRDKGVFASLVSSVRDVFFPEKLPPLELESKAIPVADPMAVKRSPTSTAIAVGVHVLIIALIAWLVAKGVKMAAPQVTHVVTPIELPVKPPKALPKATMIGGGGGQRGPTPVTKGTPPKFAEHQIVPPAPPPLQQPKIAIQPTVEVQKDVKMATSIPQIGVPNSPLVGMSMGNGNGTGLGSGSGSGIGPGSGGNIGGGVSAPQLIFQVEPEFSEEARKAKVAGNVLVTLIVDAAGHPQRVRVLRGIGMGLDEKAIEAVRQYRFKPAMEGGKPVPVEVNIDVNFQIF
jgi:protein TonB